jgi:hypothetical protein
MKVSPYTSYLELQPNALLVRQNSIICKKWVLHSVWGFLGFLHNNVVDSLVSIVLLDSNRNRVGSMDWCRCRLLMRVSVCIRALIGKMTFHTTGIALLISRR